MSSGDEVYPESVQVLFLFKGWIMRGFLDKYRY